MSCSSSEKRCSAMRSAVVNFQFFVEVKMFLCINKYYFFINALKCKLNFDLIKNVIIFIS